MNRDALRIVRDKALALAKAAGPANLLYMRAWGDLAMAADRLDAMLTRDAKPAPTEQDDNLELDEDLDELEDQDDDDALEDVEDMDEGPPAT